MVWGWLGQIGETARRIVSRWRPTDREQGHRELGRRGERLAARHLRRRGYRILERNFRAAGAEIDIVAADGATLVFVEVKARRATTAGAPEEAVDGRKQGRIRRAAEIYVARHRAYDSLMRFDVVAVLWSGKGPVIQHLEGAF